MLKKIKGTRKKGYEKEFVKLKEKEEVEKMEYQRRKK